MASALTPVSKGSAVSEEGPRYLAFMLRMWQATSDGRLVWRASLESPHTGERQGFANLHALYEFLERRAEDSVCPSDVTVAAASS
jgi:hypothetical protein